MSASKRILMVVTSHDRIDDRHPTGLWLEEYAVPFAEFRKAGYDIVTASPQGGATPIDPRSKPTPEQTAQWSEAEYALQNTVKLDTIDAVGYDAIFLPGGHGTMFDLPNNRHLQHLLRQLDREGRIIAAVCHGPAGFVNAKREGDHPLVEGRTITAFTNDEEREVGLGQVMPFLLQSKLQEEGARFITKRNWADHVERDGHLITGQNPQSSGHTARAVIEALSTLKGRQEQAA